MPTCDELYVETCSQGIDVGVQAGSPPQCCFRALRRNISAGYLRLAIDHPSTAKRLMRHSATTLGTKGTRSTSTMPDLRSITCGQLHVQEICRILVQFLCNVKMPNVSCGQPTLDPRQFQPREVTPTIFAAFIMFYI